MSMNIYNYNHFFYFYVAAKLNGVTVAARHLNTSQSSLSSQIKILESVLGHKLFKKNGRNLELTDSGREIFNYCRRAFELFDEMFDQINKSNSSMGPRISVGVSVDIEKPFITDALAITSKLYPRDKRPLLRLMSLPTPQLVELLRVGEIDFLMTTSTTVGSDFQSLVEFEFPVGIVASSEITNLNNRKSVSELIRRDKIPFVLPSKVTSLRGEIDKFFIQKKFHPVCVFESNILAAVVRAACDGLGATIMPLIYLSRELKAKKLVLLNAKPMWAHRISVITARQQLEEGRAQFVSNLIHQINELVLARENTGGAR